MSNLNWLWLLVPIGALVLLLLLVLLLRPRRKSILKKHVLITGGSLGIGKALAILAAQKGANVTIVARNEAKLKESVKEIEGHLLKRSGAEEQKVRYVSADVSSSEGLAAKLEEVTNEVGPVYLLVNCAGTSVSGRFEDTPPDEFRRLMDINYFGSVNVTRILLPQLKSDGGGCVVFVSSLAGLVGLYGYTAYSATKFAVRGFAESLQMELKPFGVGVCVNFPPDTDTPGFEEEQKGKPEETRLISESAGLLQPDAVANSILDDALCGHFFSSIGMDGWMLTTVCAGMGDCSLGKLLVQVALTGPLRLVAWCYRKHFNSLVTKCKKKREAAKREE